MSRYENGPARIAASAAASLGGQSEARPVTWRKSSFCQGGECVEVGALDGMVLVRDSKEPEHVLTYSGEEFRAFALAIKAGEYDDLMALVGC